MVSALSWTRVDGPHLTSIFILLCVFVYISVSLSIHIYRYIFLCIFHCHYSPSSVVDYLSMCNSRTFPFLFNTPTLGVVAHNSPVDLYRFQFLRQPCYYSYKYYTILLHSPRFVSIFVYLYVIVKKLVYYQFG